MVTRLSRPRTLALCALPVLALFGVAAFAPLPFTLAQPGTTANVLGDVRGTPVISIEGTPTRSTSGQLRMTTIIATGPNADVGLGDVIDSWFRTDRAVLPRDSVYPTGGSEKEIEKHNLEDMEKSQNSAVDAALTYLGKPPGSVDVTLRLANVGGPSAGLFFALGIVDKLDGDGSGGDLTGGRTVAGTGTIEANGDVGAVGGVSLKTQAARRDGATVFLVPKAECKEAGAELPKGLKLIPVTTLKSAVSSLRALEQGHKVPSC
ncbi:S16 family serine protease [Streptomyces sp. NRRL B-24720]|uniref:S16 family serine protease n=1 Tax=Streptomyces sp. NRRL B-24720 TaxID=1476876 RepID=UPI0004C876E6|nr:S16 family serine protease [Streptomyces sp. NRRL B-24720]